MLIIVRENIILNNPMSEELKKEWEIELDNDTTTAWNARGEEINIKVGQLRQWLNEDRHCEPMVTNEEIRFWLN